MPEDRIKTLREAITDGGYNVANIKPLPVVPHLDAETLKEKFDENVNSLIDAIDDSEQGLIASITEYIAYVASQIVDPGGGDTLMTKAVYDTGVISNTNKVDRARYAESVKVEVSGTTLYIGRDAD